MKSGLLTALLVGVLAVLLTLTACFPFAPGTGAFRRFSSNGERIYFSATSESGEQIYPLGGSPMMMQRVSCVNCHGPQGKGGRVSIMMWRFEAEDIRWKTLTGEHEDHPPFTEETVKRAITEGIDPAGNELKGFMPSWSMSEEDLNDLVGFLKTL